MFTIKIQYNTGHKLCNETVYAQEDAIMEHPAEMHELCQKIIYL